jgi:superfamily II DNA helicase RecQ
MGRKFSSKIPGNGPIKKLFSNSFPCNQYHKYKNVKKDIISIQKLDIEETVIGSKSPHRQNIISCFKRQQKPFEDELSFLVDHIKKRQKVQKKYIYCRSIDVVAEVFISLKEALNKKCIC